MDLRFIQYRRLVSRQESSPDRAEAQVVKCLGWLVWALLAVSCSADAGVAKASSPSSSDWQPLDKGYPGPIRLSVDATDVERGIFRVQESIPVHRAGAMTLLFPTWVPGNHAPTARIERLAGLIVTAGRQRIAWRRDPVDMHAFHLDVPFGASELNVQFDYLSATGGDQGRVVATPDMLNLQWFSLALYPAGYYARRITVEPKVRLPAGWRFSTQLSALDERDDTVSFQSTDLETLLDSPVFAGRYFRRFDLGSIGPAPASLDVVADKVEALSIPQDAIAAYGRLIRQAERLFGPPAFPRYRFMLALSDGLGGIATEHLASSEIALPLNFFSDWRWSPLPAHELSHSWNGKARRPDDLWSPDFNQPMRNSMLWLYEGQTQYWAFVLATRSGMMTREQALDAFARLAAMQLEQPGKAWRPLADTGNDAIITRELTDEPWPSWHRALNDSYVEAALMWLEADTIIRERSGEQRSLDDFARTFFTGGGERPSLYQFADVVAALGRVEPYDWEGFLRQHLESVLPAAPADWLTRSGYRLVYNDAPSQAFAEHQRRRGRVDLRHSLGLVLRPGSTGSVREVIWDSPAFAAGIVAGATILEVNGIPYAPGRLEEAIQANRNGRSPVRLSVRNRERERSISLDYRGGLRYPRLERVAGVRDRLSAVLAPRTE